jgi:membrane fusion protein, multidrug efflux system
VEVEELSESSARVTAPITGVAGLRLAEPGNMVRLTDPIVTIVQMQPIAVVFTLPQDLLPQVRSRTGQGVGLAVEAWNRDDSRKLATGHLTAIDNQIDEQTGTVKLKATFDNKDSALFPNQFVNVRLSMQ